GNLVLARPTPGFDARLSGRGPSVAAPDGWHRGSGRRRCRRVDAARGRARVWRRAGAAAVLLQGRTGRRLGRLCFSYRLGDRGSADPDLPLSFSRLVGPALECDV